MAKRRFGTNAVTGLNVGTAAHLIADHELVTSVGGWTDEEGAWRTGRDNVTVHSGSAISAMTVGRMGGQDHTVYVDGNGIYDTGSLVGTVTMGSDPRVVAIGGKFLILGASDGKNKIYDGDHVRDQGPWQPDYMSCQCDAQTVVPASDGEAITAATKASPCVLTIGTHEFRVGQRAYVSGVGGMVELNDKFWKIVAIGATTISLDVDSTGFTLYTAGGYADYRSGLTGDYKWAVTNIVELGDGSIIESRPRDVYVVPSSVSGGVVASRSYPELTPTGLWEQDATAILPGEMVVIGYDWASNDNDWKAFLTLAAGALYNITGTQGTDWKPGVRLYRTKADGLDYYLEAEFKQGDAEVSTFSDATGSGIKIARYVSSTPDAELGALYAAGPYDHGVPPQSSLATQVGQRVFLNDVDNPNRVYISGLDGTEYFNPSDWLIIPDNVTVLRRVRDRATVGTANRWYLIDMISGFPQVLELDTSTGTIYPDGVSVNDQGLFFVKPEGIFHLDLVKVSKISRRAIADGDLDAGLSALVTADVGLFVCDPAGAASTAVACIRDGGWTWHTARETLQHTHLAKNSLGQIQGALPTKIEMLFIGSDYYGSLTGKVFSDGETWQPIRLLLDVETTGSVTCQYNIQTNRGALFSGYQSTALETSKRRIVELPLNRKPAETFQLQLILDGNAKLYGYAIEVEA